MSVRNVFYHFFPKASTVPALAIQGASHYSAKTCCYESESIVPPERYPTTVAMSVELVFY